MFRLILALALCLVPGLVLAQDVVPDRRVVVSRNVDFHGADLAVILDTTLDACQAACLANGDCTAFTYNQRSAACFPKAAVNEVLPFAGAVSARIFDTDPAVLANEADRLARVAFLQGSDLSAARDLGVGIGRLHFTDERTVEALMAEAEQNRRTNDRRGALRLTGAALALTDSADLWTAYSELAVRSRSDHDVRERAIPAALNGFLRADDPGQQHEALVALAMALEQDRRGRQMIDALRAAQDAQFRKDTELLLDRAVGMYGFRVTGTDVESDSATPRLCAEMSEDLIAAGVDYAPYVQLPDRSLTVGAQGRQLCVDGAVHGARYRVVLRAGLPAASGEKLAQPVELTFYVRDRTPQVRFASRGYVLPRTGDAALPITSVNADVVELSLYKVSDRNLVRSIQEGRLASPQAGYDDYYFDRQIGSLLWQGEASLEHVLNQDTTTRLPLDAAIAGQAPGVYVLKARVPGTDQRHSPAAAQWFVLSDLGIATMQGVDGLTVVVRALGDAGAVAGAQVALVSNANEVLGTVATDATGVARFAPGLTRGTGSAAPAMVTVGTADDMAFLSLDGPAFDLSDRGVTGREPAGPIDVFLATDRGAYRAGETIHLTALMRDPQALAVPGVPLTAILSRPDGVEYARHVSASDLAGGHVFALPVGASAPRGVWTMGVYTDVDAPPLAQKTVLVEDFLPERIDVELDMAETVRQADRPPLRVQADYLFGAPAGGLGVEGEVLLRAASGIDSFPGYSFGRHDAPFSARAEAFGDGWTTGEDGAVTIDLPIPDADAGGRPLELLVKARVQELSGRPVERSTTAQVLPDSDLIGIRPGFDGPLGEGAFAEFMLIGLDRDLQPAPMDVIWTINRVSTRYQWYKAGGRWNWEPVTTRERVATGAAQLGADGPVTIGTAVDWGRYEVIVERQGGDYVAASVGFNAGWYSSADTVTTPDLLEASLDAREYAVGDTAQFRIVPRDAGVALISVLSNRVIFMQAVEVTEGENIIPLTVTGDWGAGAYVTASVIRPMDIAQGRNPARVLGLAHAGVDPGARALAVTIEAPEAALPRGPLAVAVAVDGVAQGETAHVTLAAVDVGILNLTGFQSPDPQKYYFGQRRLGVELRDLYGRLLDGMSGTMGELRMGGDRGAAPDVTSPPPTEDLLAYFRGPVTVGPDGRARVVFDLPSFNGTVRLMAVAWSDSGVGQAEAEVLVRDPVVVNLTVPRFMAPGDQSRMLIEVTHAFGPTGPVALRATGDGVGIVMPSEPFGGEVGEQSGFVRALDIVAEDVGVHEITLTAVTPDGTELTRTLKMPVLRNDPEVARTSRFTLATGNVFTLDDQVFAGMVPGSGSATLSVGPLARFDAPGLLAMLDRYPWGCTEQITSRAMPLLYLDQVAVAMGLVGADDVGQRIDEAITMILGRQARNGGFGLWRWDSGNLWLDAYVTDFLSRARARGYAVPDAAFEMAVANLSNRVNYYPDFDRGAEDLAYALLVLAREGAAAIGDLRYYADEKAQALGSAMAVAQLGAALAQYGEQRRADQLFAQAGQRLMRGQGTAEAATWRVDFGTNRRDAAAVLALALEAGSTAVDTDRLELMATRPGQPSTQEAAWTLLAASALIDDLRQTGLLVDGAAPDGPVVYLREDRVNAAPIRFENPGEETELTLTTFGVPDTPEPAGGDGYAISRSYYTPDGQEADPSGVHLGTRLVAVVTVRPFGTQEARLIIDDPLPAGFEIDNPNLLRGGDISGLEWLETAEPEHAEFRTDRFLAAVNLRGDTPFRLAYIIRAVSPGVFHHPAASVEDMYRPRMRAHTAPGQVIVLE